MGSPPRVRGKRSVSLSLELDLGITPAGAGKTQLVRIELIFLWDHPRGCGENGSNTGPYKPSQGSPPRMRGKQDMSCNTCTATGITPAGAGKTEKRNESNY